MVAIASHDHIHYNNPTNISSTTGGLNIITPMWYWNRIANNFIYRYIALWNEPMHQPFLRVKQIYDRSISLLIYVMTSINQLQSSHVIYNKSIFLYILYVTVQLCLCLYTCMSMLCMCMYACFTYVRESKTGKRICIGLHHCNCVISFSNLIASQIPTLKIADDAGHVALPLSVSNFNE